MDPAAFGPEGQEAFKKADMKEWSEWVKNRVVSDQECSPRRSGKGPMWRHLQGAVPDVEIKIDRAGTS